MSQKVFFRYNQATEQYERVFPDRRQRFAASVRVYVWAVAIVAVIALALYYLVDSPRERMLRQQNQALQQRFEILNRRADQALAVMEDIAERDNNFYRVMMQAEPMTPAQEAAMQSYVNRGYELFVSRCAEGRNVPVDSIKAIAEGRVWDGTSAAQLGLVDKLGGLDMAIAEMAADLEISDDYYVKEYPKVKFKWWEELFEISKSVKAMVMKNELGETMKYYNTIKDLNEIDHIQCRMDFVEIK